ncbi:hypothetical protein N658DRAFT_101164 [Parathielavia hyrcaniae]|uniref:Uncharacterized protein n=1 Tax=Parathielavia hyrcaniae TaxID=113614 RepID=A0AAN6PYV2_9PEZI|nr:hypothetical protein N658DRAFT_101164 [Parathielavia hyrcaniae]
MDWAKWFGCEARSHWSWPPLQHADCNCMAQAVSRARPFIGFSSCPAREDSAHAPSQKRIHPTAGGRDPAHVSGPGWRGNTRLTQTHKMAHLLQHSMTIVRSVMPRVSAARLGANVPGPHCVLCFPGRYPLHRDLCAGVLGTRHGCHASRCGCSHGEQHNIRQPTSQVPSFRNWHRQNTLPPSHHPITWTSSTLPPT